MPMLESAINLQTNIRRLSFVWVIRHWPQLEWFKKQLDENLKKAEYRNIELSVNIFVTEANLISEFANILTSTAMGKEMEISIRPKEKDNDNDSQDIRKRGTASISFDEPARTSSGHLQNRFYVLHGRPILDSVLCPIIEGALGQTGIFACGNTSFMADVRNYTARTSDDRAVHKGTGAQALYLYTQTYGW